MQDCVKAQTNLCVDQRMQVYDRITNAFSKFFTQDELQNQLNAKCDTVELLKRLSEKVSHHELHSVAKMAADLFDKI